MQNKFYEILTTNEKGQLIGGFSASIELNSDSHENNGLSNNCNGGNCSKTTCKNQKHKPSTGKNANCKGNCVKGCGNKH